MTVNPEQETGSCIADKENKLHNKQDAASTLIQVSHCVVNRNVSFCSHI